jgi:hypothetical protein
VDEQRRSACLCGERETRRAEAASLPALRQSSDDEGGAVGPSEEPGRAGRDEERLGGHAERDLNGSQQLASERVIVQSPMSFVGSYHRAMKIKRPGAGIAIAILFGLLAPTVALIH